MSKINADSELTVYTHERDESPDYTTVRDFAAVNEMDPAEIVEALHDSGEWMCSGGAAPAFVIHAVCGQLTGTWWDE